MSVSKQGGQKSENKSSNITNDMNNCVPRFKKNCAENNDSISENDHQITEILSPENVNVDFDENNEIARKRFKTVNESSLKENNLKNSNTKQTKNKNSENRNEEVVESNNDSDDFGAFNDRTEIVEQFSNKMSSAKEMLKLFNESGFIDERWRSFLIVKVIEWLVNKENSVLANIHKIEMWKNKFTSIICKINAIYDEIDKRKIFENLQVDDNGVPKNPPTPLKLIISDSVDSCDGSDDDDVVLFDTKVFTESSSNTKEINTKKKVSTNPIISKKSMESTSQVSPSTSIKPTITKTDIIDLIESDEENNLINTIKTSRYPTRNTRGSLKSVSTKLTRTLSTQPLPKNVPCTELSKSSTLSSNIVKTTTASKSDQQALNSNPKGTSKESNSYLQSKKYSPKRLVDPKQFQPSTSDHTYTSHQLPAPQKTNPQHSLLQTVPVAKPQAILRSSPSSSNSKQKNLDSGKKLPPPRPILSIPKTPGEINLVWKLPPEYNESSFAKISSYEICTYSGTHKKPRINDWKFIGNVSALPLPMTCNISNIASIDKLYFAIRAVDIHSRVGPFSVPELVMINELNSV